MKMHSIILVLKMVDDINFLSMNMSHCRALLVFSVCYYLNSTCLEPNLRRKIRVNFINAVGLNEAGIDGGGLFREFLNELLKTAFNPVRGLFKLTSDGYLYPNPNVAFIENNFGPHYYFLGRILAKVYYLLNIVEHERIMYIIVHVDFLGYL
jgi:hypothetical protein